MEKLYFASDYMETAAPEIIERLAALSGKKFTGYGSDEISESAKEKIRTAAGTPEGEVYFLVGGTQTNATVIDTMLRPYEGVIAAVTGHVSVHEAGAIEYGGHKVLALPSEEGKPKPKTLTVWQKPTGTMRTMNTWSCPPWFIFHSPLNMALFTA